MANTSHLYNDLRTLLGQSTAWTDQRHLQTLVWMVIGLICSSSISLTKWTSYFQGRALFAQSRQRRCSRWFHNPRIKVYQLYRPLIQGALASWSTSVMVLVMDTSMLWDRYCLIRVCVQYRGRAVPIAWRVMEHGSSSVKFNDYQPLLRRVSKARTPGDGNSLFSRPNICNTLLKQLLPSPLTGKLGSSKLVKSLKAEGLLTYLTKCRL